MSYNHLTLAERKKIAQMRKEGKSIRAMAKALGRSPSTISREIRRNQSIAHRHRRYSPQSAQKKYVARIRQKRKGKYANKQLVTYVGTKLLLTWSPEQVSGRIRLDYPDDPQMRIAHSTIYRWLQKEQIAQAAQLKLNLRHHGHKHGETRGKFNGVRELKERSREVLRRKRLGDWEVDTIVSAAHQGTECLLSLCDRKSRFCCLALLKRRSAAEVMRGFQVFFGNGELPLQTMTGDRGTEFACYKEVEEKWGALFYFCRPHSPWQKPSVENQNGLIRQFFPKGTAFREFSPELVAQVMDLLNNRPRKSLAFKTPAEVLHLG